MNMHAKHGIGYKINYRLRPAVAPANVLKLADGSESQWIKWTFPWHAKSLLKPYTHLHFYIPVNGPPHPSLTDVWITPENTDDAFTTEVLGFIADIWPRMVENYCPESEWSTASLVSRASKGMQTSSIDADFGFGRHPQAFWYPTLSMTLEIKKLLPPQGVKWLFLRAQAKEIKSGRMDAEVTILDQNCELVALSHHVCLVIDNADGPLKKTERRDGKLRILIICYLYVQYLAVIHALCSSITSAFLATIEVIAQSQSLHAGSPPCFQASANRIISSTSSPSFCASTSETWACAARVCLRDTPA